MNDAQRDEFLKAGGSAFPTMGFGYGMTLRDWFAGQAMVGLLAFSPDETGPGGQFAPPDAAREAYKIADAMLAARGK